MSAPTSRLPSTTARSIAVVAVVGALALAGIEPAAAAAALGGFALVAVVSGFDGSSWRIALTSALLPALVLLTIAVIGQTAELIPVVLATIGAILGLGVGGTAVDAPSATALRRGGTAAVIAAATAIGATAFALATDAAGHWRPVLEAIVWFGGDGVVGLLVGLAAATLALVCGLLAVPPAAFTTPGRRDASLAVGNALVRAIVVCAALVAASLSVTTVIGWLVPPVGHLVGSVADSELVRGLLAFTTLSGLSLLALGAVVRRSWHQEDGENAIVPVAVGTCFGAAASFVSVLVVGTRLDSTTATVALFVGVVIVLGAGAAVAWYAGTIGANGHPSSPYVTAAALAGGGIVAGIVADSGSTGLAAVRTGVTPFVAIAASLIVYDLGRYGRGLARDIGPTGATSRPQFVRVGWSGVIAVTGLVVVTGGLWVATIFQPSLSVPATMGVVVGLVVLVSGARLLYCQL